LRAPFLLHAGIWLGGKLESDMKPFPLCTLLVLLVCPLGATGALAQTSPAAGDLHGLKVQETHPKATPSPFPLSERTERRQELEYRSPEAMTAVDRDLVAANESEIARRAELQGFRLDEEPGRAIWGYEQAVCPAFPDHLILEYSRSNGGNDVSLFSVVIPRGEGHVRVIPARRRGYSLWTPSSTNALTLNDFNHMVKESPGGLDPDWLTIGLCYTALAGGHVRAGLKAVTAAEESFPLVAPATIIVTRKGGAEIRFSDTTPDTRELTWVLQFAQNGHLMKVRHGDAKLLVQKPSKESTIDIGKPGN